MLLFTNGLSEFLKGCLESVSRIWEKLQASLHELIGLPQYLTLVLLAEIPVSRTRMATFKPDLLGLWFISILDVHVHYININEQWNTLQIYYSIHWLS